MKAKPLLLVLMAAFTGCGGGGPGSLLTLGSGPPLAAPPEDPAYYNLPSTPLGAQVNSASVVFTTWNPTASALSVQLYNNWNDPLSSPASTVAMSRDANGLWTSAPAPLTPALFYVYQTPSAYVLDPYARSMAQWAHASTTIPGDAVGKGAILDPSPLLPDGGWSPTASFDGSAMKGPDGVSSAPYAYASSRDAIIYEAGIRDLTVDPSLGAFAPGHTWGTFKGLIDLLPHIQKLGVTHVQLLCPLENYAYDQTRNGLRELNPSQTSGANHSWGYDPQNYFTPSGMYSAAPADPTARIQEMKTLINEIHKQGMGVILDLVFDHTANDAVLGDPGLLDYYYRATSDNGSGSRDVKSENMMTRKLIVDAVVQWTSAYRADGFRFNLMGVLDDQTILTADNAARDLNPNILFVGEGWPGYYSGAATDYDGHAIAGADQAHAAQFLGRNLGLFSDSFRQIFKNGGATDGGPAFLTGQPQAAGALFANISGQPTNFSPGSTNGVVNNLTSHDGLCLYDALALATGSTKAQDEQILQRARIGYALLFTSQGAAFLQGGDEMFRTRETTAPPGAPNTLSGASRTFVNHASHASDALNQVAWSTVYAGDPIAGNFTNYALSQKGCQLYAYTQGLIAIRKSTNAFRLPDMALASNLTLLTADGAGASTLAFGYRAAATDGTGTYYVFHNADSAAHAFAVPASLTSAGLLADGASSGLTAIQGSTTATLSPDGKTVTLAPLTSAIFKR